MDNSDTKQAEQLNETAVSVSAVLKTKSLVKRCTHTDDIAKDKFALELSYSISNDELLETLKNAKNKIKDWEKSSRRNKGLSIGAHWNMFCKDIDFNSDLSIIIKYRILEQYKEFLPNNLKENKIKRQKVIPTHSKPIFDNLPF